MSTLSQRLRDLRIGLFPDIETVNEVLDECIAQAEALEAQAGELSVERIMQAVKRAGSQMPYGHINYDMIRAELTKAGPVVAHLNMDPNASPETIEAVKDVVQKAYSYKPSQAIGEQTPVAKPNDWSNPEFRAKTFLERMPRLRADVSMWQGKCSVLRHENNRLRAKPSPEARDTAIEALAKDAVDLIKVLANQIHGLPQASITALSHRAFNEMFDTANGAAYGQAKSIVDRYQALSALRGQ